MSHTLPTHTQELPGSVDSFVDACKLVIKWMVWHFMQQWAEYFAVQDNYDTVAAAASSPLAESSYLLRDVLVWLICTVTSSAFNLAARWIENVRLAQQVVANLVQAWLRRPHHKPCVG